VSSDSEPKNFLLELQSNFKASVGQPVAVNHTSTRSQVKLYEPSETYTEAFAVYWDGFFSGNLGSAGEFCLEQPRSR
jgi:hypothetical protein